MKVCAIVLGGYVNGYSIIQELYESGIRDIILFSNGRQLANFSNKIVRFINIENTDISILKAIEETHRAYDYIVPFPTNDFQVEALYRISQSIKEYCFLPFNPDNVLKSGNKIYQYQYCEQLEIPYPMTRGIDNIETYDELKQFRFPLIIKPATRKDITTSVFRTLQINSPEELDDKRNVINAFINDDITFLASEIIPGDTSGTIVAYTAYRSHQGEILNEWIGKKLTQYPDDYGVFSSVVNQCDPIILEYGRKLLNGMNLVGINEPEFKYDEIDGKYKLTEINLRSMMWHRLGNLSGVNLQYTQWCDALGIPVKKQEQKCDQEIHFCYYKHEILNLLNRKNYFNHYKYNLKMGDKIYFAIKDKTDIKPYLFDQYQTLLSVIKTLIKRIVKWRR